MVEVEQTLEEVQRGTYKSRLMARMDPGRTLNADTFLITRMEEHVLSYGFSNTLRLDTWNTPLRLGTVPKSAVLLSENINAPLTGRRGVVWCFDLV